MKKLIALILAVLMVVSFAACGQNNKPTDPNDPEQNNSQTNDDNHQTVIPTPEEIEEKIKKALGDDYSCNVDKEKDFLTGYWGLDLSQIESYVAKENAIASVNPDQIIILKVKDGYADKAVEALNAGFAQNVSYIRQYPFGTEKVLNGRIFKNGNYVALIIAGQTTEEGTTAEQEAKMAEEDYQKIDGVWEELFGEAKNLAVVPEDDGSNGGLLPDDGNAPLVGGN